MTRRTKVPFKSFLSPSIELIGFLVEDGAVINRNSEVANGDEFADEEWQKEKEALQREFERLKEEVMREADEGNVDEEVPDELPEAEEGDEEGAEGDSDEDEDEDDDMDEEEESEDENDEEEEGNDGEEKNDTEDEVLPFFLFTIAFLSHFRFLFVLFGVNHL